MKVNLCQIILTIALIFAITLGFIPGIKTAMTVHAVDFYYSGTCTSCGNIDWKWEDDVLTISKSDAAKSGYMCNECYKAWSELYIREAVVEKGVTSIGWYAFYDSALTKITMPNTIERIGTMAFYDCDGLESVVIPEGTQTIGTFAFMNCDYLKKIELPNSLTDIDVQAFWNCINLKTIDLPENLETIGMAAFDSCGLTSITIPGSVTTIAENAFQYCDELATANVPCGLKQQITENTVFTGCDVSITYSHSITVCTANNTTKTLTGSCGCGAKTYKATLKAPSNTAYTGVAIEATCTNTIPGFTPTIKYSGNNLVNGKPVNAGTYTATLSYNKSASVSISYTILATPSKPHKITNVVSGVHVYWPAVTGISKYGLWRSETGINGTYKWIANPTVAHFTDTKVESGKTYYYKVTTLDTVNNVHSAKSAAIGITYVATPDITLRVNRATGIGLGWDKISGATGYAIYRKPYDGNSDWVRVATITDPNTLKWDDTSVKTANGTVYKYTIRALAGSNRTILSGCRATGRTMVRLTSRDLNSAVKTGATSIKCNWSTTTQATGYEVRFMVGNTVYKTYTIGNYNTGTKTFTGLKAGQTYKIQVRTYKKVDGVGSFYSAWSTAKTVSL